MDDKILQNAGLTKVEAKIYSSLIDLGPSLAGQISRKSGIHRRSVYDAMERLIEKGLVSYISKNNRRYYEAANPERLLEIIKEKENALNAAIPDLIKRFSFVKEKEETLFYKGKEGLKTIFEDQINEGKDIFVFGGSANANEIVKYYFPHYDRQRIKKKIKIKIIFDKEDKNKIGKIPLAEIRFLPKGYGGLTATNIYADKVAIILWSEQPLAILIKNREIAKSYKNYFDLLWRIAK